MDFKVMNKAISTNETLFDDFDERPVDCDFVLPDYCPDIAAVLKCTLKPVIQSKQLSGDRMLVDGQANIRVMYLDEARKCVRCCYAGNTCQAVTAITAEDNAEFPPERAALKIYFAGGGESIWEIAKNCHTSMNAVMEENNLSSEILPEDTMLLVPLC